MPGSLAHGAVCELCKAWGFISPNEPWFYGPLLTEECSAAQPGGDLVPLRPLPKDMVDADYADLGFAGSYSSPFADWLIVAGLAIVTIIAGLIVYEFEHIAVGHAGIVAHMQATHPAGG